MAGYLTESSSDEEFSSNRGQSGSGIQPYRFEPACQNRKESAVLDSEEEVGNDPFTHGINFGSRVGQPANEWCTCDRCAAMASPVMNICCHELEELEPKLYTDDLDCILLHRDFNVVVLEEAVLRTALVGMKDVKRTSFVEPIKERTFRLAAYRQFTWWCHRRLGKGVRKVIPSCVVRKIRESYPDPSENYTGFREADETDNVYPD